MSGELIFAPVVSANALLFCRSLSEYLAARLGVACSVLEDVAWQGNERQLYAGTAHLGFVCGLQYVCAVARDEQPGVEVLAAPVMSGPRYGGKPVYFSDVVVRGNSAAGELADLRGAIWGYNEPTSHSGYGVIRYELARRGFGGQFFGKVVATGAHLASLSMLLAGRIDATAIDSVVLEQELKNRPELADEIRVIESLGPSPAPPLVVSRVVFSALRSELGAALLSMHLTAEGQMVLSSASVMCFAPVIDADYDPIREMARVADQLEPWGTLAVRETV